MFKLIVLYLIFCATRLCLSEDPPKNGVVEETIIEKFETFRSKLPETYLLEDIELNIPENYYINGQLKINKLELSGVKHFNISKISYNWLTRHLDFNLDFSSVKLFLNYHTNVTIGTTTDVYANNVTLTNDIFGLKFKTNSAVFPSIIKPQLWFLHANTTIQDIYFDLRGFFSDDISQQITEGVNKYLLSYLEDQKEDLDKYGSPVIQTVLNTILSK